ncbi:thioredoxin family protein [uncultured Rubinisphaera sp.]|uniref:thioredoxin family protein n=1 Tax=uncultured Rubinisphaera sp. TaxID=1678686 RepID=UPI0030DBBF3C
MRLIICFLVAILGFSLFQWPAQAETVRNLNELKAQMTQLGKPALVIAGADWCVYCREMSQELATSPELQPLQKDFAILKIDVDTPVWDIAKRVFEFDGTGVPAVFIFRADGEKLYSASGKPSDMEGFLKRYRDKSGRILTTTEARDLSRDLTKIQGLLKKDDLAGAIEIAMPYEFKDCYAQTATAMMDVKSQIDVLVTDQIAKLDEKLKQTPVDFAVVVELVQLKQTCQSSRELLAKVQSIEENFAAEEANQKLVA